MKKQITVEQAVEKIKDGMTIMVGGFLSNGSANAILTELSKKNIKNLTIICNDTSFPDKGVGKLIVNKQIAKVYTSHIGTNPHSNEQLNSGEMIVEFCPQGTLAERIRTAGAGLGGVLTPTGLGTIVANGKEIIKIDGNDFLLEKPLKADVALIGASLGDKAGNLVYKGTSQNMNPLMATAADLVIAEVKELVETGEIPAENIHTQGIFVDYIILFC